MEKKIKTKTSTHSFGSKGRISHNSQSFYSRKIIESFKEKYHFENLKENVSVAENLIPPFLKNTILNQSSENMKDLPDRSIHLIITSPPYNVGKEYDQDISFDDYRNFLKQVFKECYRVLTWGGRICINIANLGRKPYIPLHAFLIQDMLELGFLMRGEIIWVKEGGGAPSTAWGTWQSAKNPILRDEHEYILVFSKGEYTRKKEKDKKDTLTKEEFLNYTKSVWHIKPESAKKIGHPAPFPVELPVRLIKLFSYTQDVVLDPFMGSGQTAIASLMTNRYYVGYEIHPEYVELANIRIKEFLKNPSLAQRELFV
ncbi:MAG: site-specific DNA-methyltransferase [Leptospiraceae bacterium]|nr:site-specific DNA-methyltransferase [Leptospiraceae bacterium]MDW7975708.1 site-specific DNA-methyltransferase [Leptospiraceae bacterium]